MTESSNKLERIGFGLILFVALLMFFSPLVKLRGPDGDLPGDGYYIRVETARLQSGLDVVTNFKPSENQSIPTRSVTETPTNADPSGMPLSLRNASLVPWLIFAALVCAALALLDLLSFQSAVATISLVGGCLGALAAIQVVLMGSDLRSWTADLISRGALGAPDDPILVTRMLMVNSFQVRLGPGLLVLTTCLLLVPFLSFTRGIPRVKSVVRRDPRVRVSQPVRVRPVNSRYPEEMCTSFDVSRGGISVESASNHCYVGMEVYVNDNAHPGDSTNPEKHGTVVRVEKLENGKCRFAIRYISAL